MITASRLALIIVAVLLGGCGSSTDGGAPPSTAVPATSVAAGQLGSTFDPCNDIGDQVVRELGFNPATRESKPPTGEYTAACQFASAEMSLTVATSTTSFEEFRDRYIGVRVGANIDNRPAVIVRKPQVDLPCELALKADDGIVTLQTSLNVAAKEWGMDRCARIVDIATGIEPLIGSR